MAKRVKRMSEDRFREVREREWRPVRLEGDAVPEFLRGLPTEKLHAVLASGTERLGVPYSDERLVGGELIGGIDVFRNAPDDPVELNKDWYAVVCVAGEAALMVPGPFKDGDHWLDELPRHLVEVEVFGVPRKR